MTHCKSRAKNLGVWFATEQGNYVLAREQSYFDHTVNDIFGFNALQLGLPEYDFLRNSRIPLHFTGSEQSNATVRMCPDELPIASGSMDLVILPHTLEFSEQPHAILREVERVLIAEGSLIISGFNPHSLWGLHHLFADKRDYPWCGHFIALSRLKDWLSLLGFEVAGGRFSAYAPPFSKKKWLEHIDFMEAAGDRWWAVSGGIYLLYAIKRVPGIRPLKAEWRVVMAGKLLPVTHKMNRKGLKSGAQTMKQYVGIKDE
jgi:SAM-dependent methyltransferase